MSEWTGPAELTRQVERLWERGRILGAAVGGESLFPLRLRLRGPTRSDLADRFDDVRRWIGELEESSKGVRGYGYDLEWTGSRHRQLGRNRWPSGAMVETEDDALRLIGKRRDAARFREIVAATEASFPALREWLSRSPLTALEHAPHWSRVLAVLAWFREHPRCGHYLRQLDIPGVDTKFIEDHRGLIAALLERVLPPESIDATAAGARGFEARYGLRCKPALVRFRILDRRLRLRGLSDLTVPVGELAELRLDARRVFVTENEFNGLAFPELPGSIVIFGMGYRAELLAGIGWLAGVDVHYWGDIDTHGFGILDRLRGALPNARSFLMDRDTLLTHRALWVTEESGETRELNRLTDAERALYEELRGDRYGQKVRLEQERVGFAWVQRALREVLFVG
jgi:hypothetical protein